MDLFDVPRPGHLDNHGWEAVNRAKERLQTAWESKDLPEVIGKAKELVETVAKVTVVAVDGAVSDSMDFASVVKDAHARLKRQPGPDLTQDPNIRAIAQGAQTVATRLGPMRNTHGTGHGRAMVPDVAQEMAATALEASLLWSRWALRRLDHLLADYPNDLIDAVQSATTRTTLRTKFQAATLGQQPLDVQHRIGVAFGQQAAGGFGNATEVGLDPAVDGGYGEYPIQYRRGLLEGMVLAPSGTIGLPEFYAAQFVSLLASLPSADIHAVLGRLREVVDGTPWLQQWRGTTQISSADVVASLRREATRLPDEHMGAFERFCSGLEAANVLGDT